jgi:hypothetical protein
MNLPKAATPTKCQKLHMIWAMGLMLIFLQITLDPSGHPSSVFLASGFLFFIFIFCFIFYFTLFLAKLNIISAIMRVICCYRSNTGAVKGGIRVSSWIQIHYLSHRCTP